MASKAEELNWKRRSSDIRGYERTMYATNSSGDYLRIDYNIAEKLVRLYTEVAAEDGDFYFSVIQNGAVLGEKNSRGKSTHVTEKLKERAADFSTFPNKDIFPLINQNYGISGKTGGNSGNEKKSKKEQFNAEREEIKRKYFGPDGISSINLGSVLYRSVGLKKIGFVDFVDIIAGILISALFFYLNQYSFLTAGAAAAIWGLILGIVDIFIREKDPAFLKILLFLFSGTGLYIYSYLYL